MKKILLLLGLFALVPKAHAFDETTWTDEVVNDPNIAIKESEIRYKWYREEIAKSNDYYIEGENDLKYPFILRDDHIETEWSDWIDYHPGLKSNRDIEFKLVNRYRTIKPIRYLFLENFQGGYTTFRIAELNVLINGEKKNVSMTCNNCSTDFNYYINDGLLIDNAYISNGGNLMIDLGGYYLIDDVRLELYMYDSVPNTKKVDIYYNAGSTLTDRNYAHKQIDIYVVSNNYNQPERHLIIPNATYIENPIWDEWVYIEGMINATYYRQMQITNLYRYKDIKYNYYKIDRIYADGYYDKYEDSSYIRDEDSAKMFYLYENNKTQNINTSVQLNESESKETVSDNAIYSNIDEVIVDNTMNENTNISPNVVDKIPEEEPVYGAKKDTNVRNLSNSYNFRILIIFILFFLGISLTIFGVRKQKLSHQN